MNMKHYFLAAAVLVGGSPAIAQEKHESKIQPPRTGEQVDLP